MDKKYEYKNPVLVKLGDVAKDFINNYEYIEDETEREETLEVYASSYNPACGYGPACYG